MFLKKTILFIIWIAISTSLFAQINNVKIDTSHFDVDSLLLQKQKIPLHLSNTPEIVFNKDSLIRNYTVKSDSLLKKGKAKKDSLYTKKEFRNFISHPTGSISAGYDYGVIPFASNCGIL